MADTKISAAADIVSVVSTDMLPVARSGSATAYHATMAEISTWANVNLPTASTTVLGASKIDGTTITIASGVISAPSPYGSTPAMDGAGAPGAATQWSRGDHVHPSDTTRAPLASPTFTGTVTIPAGATITGYAPLASPTFTGTPSLPTGTTGITQTAGNNTTALATTQFVQAAAAPAFNDTGRNRLHNPAFSINQRGYASGTALPAAAYGHDRWKAGASGCTYTFTQSQPFTTITITAGSLQQIVEAMAVEGGTYTLSWTGTAQGRVGAGSYATSPVTVTGLAANTAITVEFNAGTLGRAQLEPGSTATTPERRDPMLELALCQRFYQYGFVMYYGYGAAGQIVGYAQLLPVVMRASPAVAYSGITYNNASAITAGFLGASYVGTIVTVGSAGIMSVTSSFTASADL